MAKKSVFIIDPGLFWPFTGKNSSFWHSKYLVRKLNLSSIYWFAVRLFKVLMCREITKLNGSTMLRRGYLYMGPQGNKDIFFFQLGFGLSIFNLVINLVSAYQCFQASFHSEGIPFFVFFCISSKISLRGRCVTEGLPRLLLHGIDLNPIVLFCKKKTGPIWLGARLQQAFWLA